MRGTEDRPCLKGQRDVTAGTQSSLAETGGAAADRAPTAPFRDRKKEIELHYLNEARRAPLSMDASRVRQREAEEIFDLSERQDHGVRVSILQV